MSNKNAKVYKYDSKESMPSSALSGKHVEWHDVYSLPQQHQGTSNLIDRSPYFNLSHTLILSTVSCGSTTVIYILMHIKICWGMFLIILALIIGADRQTIGQSALVLRRVKV